MDISAAHNQSEQDAPAPVADGQTPFSPSLPRPLPRPPAQGLAPSLEHRRFRVYIFQLIVDVLLLLGCFAAAAAVYEPVAMSNESMLSAYLMLPLFQTIAFYNAAYSRGGLTDWRASSGRAVAALLVSALMLNFFAFFAKMNAEFSRVVFAAGLAATAVCLTAFRYAVSRWIVAQWGPSTTNRLLIEAGGPNVAIAHLYRINAEEHGLRPDIEDPIALDRLSKYLQNMDQVIVSCELSQRVAWSEVLKGSGIHCEVISEFAREIGALGIVHHHEAKVSALLISSGYLGMRSRAMKRLFDIVSSLTALIVLAPLMLLCALLIKLEDGGSVFFMQRRMGRGNQFFDIFKFRSMREKRGDAHGVRSASKDDDRVTRIGRFIRSTSIDELPQLINVLRGEMSIVGPRPHALGSLAGKKMFWQVDRKYWQRHSLRPGITGLAQVRGFRGATDHEIDLANRLQADLEYMNTWSLWGDVKIILGTLRVLVHHRAF